MSSPTERHLRELFAADAAAAPDAGGLATVTLHRVRRRRRVRRTVAAGLVAAAAVVGGTAAGWDPLASDPSPVAAPTGVGALPGDATTDCQGYSVVGLAALLTRDGGFAFDGTVAAVEPGPDLGPEMPRQMVRVTFQVRTWYAGGSGGTVDVLLDGPDTEDSEVRAYGIGTRLLVSGVLASTERASGAMPVDDDMARFGFTCGYTRYFDGATADEWTAVAAGELPAGPLPEEDASGCPGYSPALVAETGFALDGTVTEIGQQRFPPLPGDPADGYYSVTFEVHAWYRGGTGETVTVHMTAPYVETAQGFDETYALGSRLLVAGDVSDVEGRGPIAEGCGLIRYYDEATAAEWAAAA
ncbi:hypothetical protein JKP75_10290 [Blastococcus sp. TML/M2B]|uniref:hypothetical protein n=1 Tax=unclassified Blastococcus TaxID=2619396 RepID=UPI00190B8E27|nr:MULTISPECIES: hypothetical protein [unclassified Blastococcus]MBN1092917.1 hypothetical protein [Blastococcus sp. TML/M2B]MBN1096978.1 hypothetical protein [Blastococcus sp. TML/C7B]